MRFNQTWILTDTGDYYLPLFSSSWVIYNDENSPLSVCHHDYLGLISSGIDAFSLQLQVSAC